MLCKDLVMLMLDFALSLLALPIFSDKVPLCTSGGFRWRAFKTFWGEVSSNLWPWHHHQFNKKTLEVVHMQMVSMEKNSPKMSWIKDHYHDHQLKPQLEDDPLRVERAQ